MSPNKALYLEKLSNEFNDVEIDKRLAQRLKMSVDLIAVEPSASFPKLLKKESELEGLYRLVNNESVSWQDICAPHFRASIDRCAYSGIARIVHDTTDFAFSGEREGLGRIAGKTNGFFTHAALAVSGDESRCALGMVGLIPYVRPQKKDKPLNQRKLEARAKPRNQKESSRWETLAIDVGQRMLTREFIHIMDQEGDDYTMIAKLQAANQRFVVRGSSKRRINPRDDKTLSDVLKKAPAEVFRTVPLSARAVPPRPMTPKKGHPPREERTAKLHLRWTHVTLQKAYHAQSESEFITVYCVQVFEPNPPAGEQRIEWTLLTSERVENFDDAVAVVDHYRARWRIEEYFRAIKTGCAFEERQLTTYDALLSTLAILIPIAWQLLLLRTLGRDETPIPASDVFSHEELTLIALLASQYASHEMPKKPTMRDAMYAIAAIGGHIRNNGPPGWIVLGRGYSEFVRACSLSRLVLASQRCAES